jgi:hypothetical protein
MGDWGRSMAIRVRISKWIAIGRSRRIGWLWVANNRERFATSSAHA